jgi:hypothetical protein
MSEYLSLLRQFTGLVAQVDMVTVPIKCGCTECKEDGLSGTRLTRSKG